MQIRKRKKRPMPIPPMTALGDIAFLLIIFFMITSNFIREAHVDLDKAESRDVEKLEQRSVSVAVDKNGEVYVQGEKVQVDALTNIVESAVTPPEIKQIAMLKIDKNMPYEKYKDVISALAEAQVEIALVGKEEVD